MTKANTKRRRRIITDPVEIARREAERRRDPSKWGLRLEGLGLPANADVLVEQATRRNLTRAARYNVFRLLFARGAIEAHHVGATVRLAELLAVRAAVAGSPGVGEHVDTSPALRIGVTDARIRAGDCADYVIERTGRASAVLLLALLEPEVASGQPLKHWRSVVELISGESHPHAQCARVRAACDNLVAALGELDKAPKAALAVGRRARDKVEAA